MTLIPAYGRDYKSKAAVLKDWNANKDFIIADMFHHADGKPTNKADLVNMGEATATVRYSKLTKLLVIRL